MKKAFLDHMTIFNGQRYSLTLFKFVFTIDQPINTVTYLECEAGTTDATGMMDESGERDAVEAGAGGHKGFCRRRIGALQLIATGLSDERITKRSTEFLAHPMKLS